MCIIQDNSSRQNRPMVYFFFFLPHFFYCCSSTVVPISPPPLLCHPSHPHFPPLIPPPFGFVHVSFIHVSEDPSPSPPAIFPSHLPSGYCQFVLYFSVFTSVESNGEIRNLSYGCLVSDFIFQGKCVFMV